MSDLTASTGTSFADLFAEGRASKFLFICLAVWLNAADSLVTATIMPNVGADLGGYPFFSWAVAGFLMGAILASASAGRLSELLGLRFATTIAGVIFAVGCAMSALAPTIDIFLVGRIVQGFGSGWISGFAMVAIALLFPERHLARMFASTAGVWGIATVVGPLIGGILAQAGNWRAVFWLFAVQAALFSSVAPFLLRSNAGKRFQSSIPWLQLILLTLGVGAIAMANLGGSSTAAIGFVAIGLAVLLFVLWVDGRAPVRMFPHRAGSLRTTAGLGYAAMFALFASSMSLIVYVPPILQVTRHLSPMSAGYVVAAQALAWTLTAFAVANATGASADRCIRLGGVCILTSVACLMAGLGRAPLPMIIGSASLMGIGFGLCFSFINRRVLGVLSAEDRSIGASAFIVVRQTGGAVGAAIAGAAANLAGFQAGMTAAAAQSTSIWVFATALPLALAGAWAAWRLSFDSGPG